MGRLGLSNWCPVHMSSQLQLDEKITLQENLLCRKAYFVGILAL